MSGPSLRDATTATRSQFYYGWVIVGISTLLLAITYGLMYSYSVFFKPLAEFFQWDRETVSLIYSASLFIRGAASIGIGWLADKYSPLKIMVICGFLVGLGLALSSQASTLWQFFVTYALIEAIGLSGAFGIGTAVASRWFTRNRGLAMGIVSSGVGLGTLLIVPGAERLISALDWSRTFIILGIAAGAILIVASLFLRPAPASTPAAGNMTGLERPALKTWRGPHSPARELNLGGALRSSRMITMILVFALLIFCTQMVIVHLVNYATDIGISPLVAATFVSLMGFSSIGGRLAMGVGADRIGLHNSLILCCILAVLSMVILLFSGPLWTFYLFAVIFGFAYGGEVPQIPLFVSRFGGTKSMATLIGLTLFVGNIGGALGPWLGGKIFDASASYYPAFLVGTLSITLALILALILKRQNRTSA
ncbi:MAG: transporter [Chloroflexi bacterium]|nr:transporter [Chloroflexota bacterium]